MTSSDTAADFAASLLTQLHDAEVLPDTWYHVAADNLSSYSSGELYTSSDSLGITRLLRYPHAAYDESDPEYNESPTFALDYDNKTGRLLNLWFRPRWTIPPAVRQPGIAEYLRPAERLGAVGGPYRPGRLDRALRQRLRRNRPVQRQRQRPADLCVRLLYP